MNDVIALDMRSESGRWRVLALAIESINTARMDVATMWAPRFRSGSWFTVVSTSYWTDYAKARHRADIRFLDVLPPSDKLKGVAYLDYFLADDESSYITTVARLRPTDASEPNVLADMIAVHLERQTATMLRTFRLVFRDHNGTLRQIPLERLTAHGARGEIRVLDNVRAVPASIRIARQSFLEQDLRPCATAVTVRHIVHFATKGATKDWDCSGPAFLQSGWGAPEAGGVWSLGAEARLSVTTTTEPGTLSGISFDLSTYTGLGFATGTQTVRAYLNGRPMAIWTFTRGQAAPDTRISIPPDVVDASGVLNLRFEIDPPMNPSQLKTANDNRDLGINLKSLRIEASRP
jgi:hypothetical protein